MEKLFSPPRSNFDFGVSYDTKIGEIKILDGWQLS